MPKVSRMNRWPALLAVCLVVLAACGCTGNGGDGGPVTPLDEPRVPARGFYMGILPTSAQAQEPGTAYSMAADNAEFVPVWGRPTPFYRMADDLKGDWGDLFLERLIRENGMFPLVHMSFIDVGMELAAPSAMPEATLSDPQWREAYKKAAVDIVRAARPLYMSLGNEVNRWWEAYGANSSDPDGFQHFVSLYNEVYDAVKEASPDTVVFCTFAREVVAQNREANLTVLEMFDPARLDVLVFTSYAYAVQGVSKPLDLPDDYFSRAYEHLNTTNRRFGLSELGWTDVAMFGGEAAQADFIDHCAYRLTQNQGLDLELFAWSWLTDLNENDSVGLIYYDGTEKAAYARWMELSRGGGGV